MDGQFGRNGKYWYDWTNRLYRMVRCDRKYRYFRVKWFYRVYWLDWENGHYRNNGYYWSNGYYRNYRLYWMVGYYW
jgi:hypothetical protein